MRNFLPKAKKVYLNVHLFRRKRRVSFLSFWPICEEQVGKKAADMIQPAYYLSISGDVFADPAFSLSNGQVVTVTLRARSS